MRKKRKIEPVQRRSHHQLFYLFVIVIAFGLVVSYLYTASKAAETGAPTLKLGTYLPDIPTDVPIPTTASPIPTVPIITSPPGAIITPAIGGPQPPQGYYCIDDEDPDMCDDNSSHLVPKGSGGVDGACGTVIENTHHLVDALPQVMKGLRDSLSKTVSTNCASTGPASGYVSTHLVIDAYNLAGFPELSKNDPNHVSPSGLFNFWQSPPSGYEFVPYTPEVVQQFGSGQKDLTGCVMFLQTSSSYHIGIVNFLEQYSSNGDGVISILQSGTRMWVDRFPVVGWNIQNSSTNQTTTSGVAGFGCHT